MGVMKTNITERNNPGPKDHEPRSIGSVLEHVLQGICPTVYRSLRIQPKPYDISGVGDKRYSPLHARLSDGRTISQAVHMDCMPIKDAYLQYFNENPALYLTLKTLLKSKRFFLVDQVSYPWAQEHIEVLNYLVDNCVVIHDRLDINISKTTILEYGEPLIDEE